MHGKGKFINQIIKERYEGDWLLGLKHGDGL
jgi:hypothetical protein